ncbi:hypothetical protein ACFL0Y_01200 [Patescibacteria group bacterium]
MDLKSLLAKIISVFLLIFSAYQTLLSINAIFFIYPNLDFQGQERFLIQTGLLDKALLIYISMITSGTYGFALLLKPTSKLKIIHIVSGILVFALSVFFVTKTPFTTDPMLEYFTSR